MRLWNANTCAVWSLSPCSSPGRNLRTMPAVLQGIEAVRAPLPLSFIWLHHLYEHGLVEWSKPFGMSHHGNLPWPCHVEMQLGNVDTLPDFFDMALVGGHLHVGHPGTRHNLGLLNREALWICQIQFERSEPNGSR